MQTKKAFLSIFACSGLLVAPSSAGASLAVTEVMYDPAGTDSGREWIEVVNDGAEAVDLEDVALLEADVRHKIVASAGGSTLLPAGERAVIADKPELFALDHPGIARVYDSAFSMSNSGERIALVDADGDEFGFAIWDASSGATDGRSWQLGGAGWVAAEPTPGAENADREDPPAPAPTSTSPKPATVSAHSGTGGLTTVKTPPSLAVDAGRNRVVPVGAEIEIAPVAKGSDRAAYSWSWGDGASSKGRRGRHVYRFPGTYAVVLNAHGDGGSAATSRTTVTAVAVEVEMGVVDEGGESGIAVTNRSAHELNLGGFRIEADGDDYELPADTIALPNVPLVVPGEVSGLAAAATTTTALRRPDGKVVASV